MHARAYIMAGHRYEVGKPSQYQERVGVLHVEI